MDNSAWECPPGLGVCPLDVIFGTCKIIHNYLRSSEEHVVVSPEVMSRGFNLTSLQARLVDSVQLLGTDFCLGMVRTSCTVMALSALQGTMSCIVSAIEACPSLQHSSAVYINPSCRC